MLYAQSARRRGETGCPTGIESRFTGPTANVDNGTAASFGGPAVATTSFPSAHSSSRRNP